MGDPYRVPSNPEPERFEEADAYEALLRVRAAQGRRAIVGICGALTILSIAALAERPPKQRIITTAESRAKARFARARDSVESARAYAERAQARFAATMNAVLDFVFSISLLVALVERACSSCSKRRARGGGLSGGPHARW